MSTAPETSHCSQCGAPKPPQAACPHCLLQLGLSAAWPTGPAGRAPRALAPAPAPEELARHFPGLEIQEAIGQGGMGVVYRARHKKLDRLVALKILSAGLGSDPAFAERFLREARAMARLDHPHIVAVYDFGETEGLCWLLMEYVDGLNLRAAMQSGALTPERALAIVPQLCDALQAAHDLGVVHRDIKPENVLLDREGRVKVADFGLAKLTGVEGEVLALTQSDVGMGTPHYMAPEQLRGAHAVDHRADIYSLGVVFYEMLTGKLPIGRFELPSHALRLDVRLDEVVLRALEHEPTKRYQQAAEVKTDVQAIPRGAPADQAARPSPPLSPLSTATQPSATTPARTTGLEPEAGWRGRIAPIGAVLTPALLLPTLLRAASNLGTDGVFLLLAGTLLWLYALTRMVAGTQPTFTGSSGRRSATEVWLRNCAFALCAGFGLLAFGASIQARWELGTDQYVSPTSQFQAMVESWTKEGGEQLLSLLPGGDPASLEGLELGYPQRDTYRRTHLLNSMGSLLIAGIGLWLAGIAQCWHPKRNAWLAISAPLVGTLLLAGFAWVHVQVRQSDEPGGMRALVDSMVLDEDIHSVRSKLEDRLWRQGDQLVLEIGETLVEKQSRQPIARHELLGSQPEGTLDRWSYERDGPTRVMPGLVIELLGVEGGSQTYVSWNAGLLHEGDPRERAWRERIEALFD